MRLSKKITRATPHANRCLVPLINSVPRSAAFQTPPRGQWIFHHASAKRRKKPGDRIESMPGGRNLSRGADRAPGSVAIP